MARALRFSPAMEPKPARIAVPPGRPAVARAAGACLAVALGMAQFLWPWAARAEMFGPLLPGGGDPCAVFIDRVERDQNIPAQLLMAVALVESGRTVPESGERIAWPWTVNNAGDGRFYATKGEAIAAVRALKARGERNIDVGCMQVNLMHHPDAFADLNEAFDPEANVQYAASFLKELRDARHSWTLAVANYHSATPELGQVYRKKVFDTWTQARVETDSKQREAIIAEYQARRLRNSAAMVQVLRPRDSTDRFAWVAPGAPPSIAMKQSLQSGTPLRWFRLPQPPRDNPTPVSFD